MPRRKASETGNLPAARVEANVPANWIDDLAGYASKQASAEKIMGGSSYISMKGGRFNYKGNPIGTPTDDRRGEYLDVVVLDAVYDFAWYSKPFNEAQATSPDCFAIGEDLDELESAPESPNRQGTNPEAGDFHCSGCWANAFRSAENGRGKACRNSRRLAVFAANELDGIMGSEPEIALLRIPPTSLKNWGAYMNSLKAMPLDEKRGLSGYPKWGVVTRLTIMPKGGAWEVDASMAHDLSPVQNFSLAQRLMKLAQGVQDELLAGYPIIADGAAQGSPRQGGRPAGNGAAAAAPPSPAAQAPDTAPRAGGFGGRQARPSSGARRQAEPAPRNGKY